MSDENKMATEALKWIIHDIRERKKEADTEKNKDEFSEGRAQAYFEVIDMIESRLKVLDVHIENENK